MPIPRPRGAGWQEASLAPPVPLGTHPGLLSGTAALLGGELATLLFHGSI